MHVRIARFTVHCWDHPGHSGSFPSPLASNHSTSVTPSCNNQKWLQMWLSVPLGTTITSDWESQTSKLPEERLSNLRFCCWGGKIPCRKKWQATPVFLPGKSQGQRSLVGYSSWGHKESDTTEWLTLSLSLFQQPFVFLFTTRLENPWGQSLCSGSSCVSNAQHSARQILG